MAGLLVNLGHVAGGAVKGWTQAREDLRQQEEQEYRRQERERDKKLQLAAGNTFANVGHAREDGSTFTDADAATEYLKQSAPYDRNPLQTRAAAQGLRKGEIDIQSGQLGLQGAQRGERQATMQERIQAMERDLAAGGNHLEIFQQIQQMNRQVPNGYGSAVFSFAGPDGKMVPHTVVFDESTGQGNAFPLTPQNVGKALKKLYDSTSGATRQAAETRGIQERQVGAAETTAAAATTNAQTNAGYRRDQAPVLQSQALYYDRMGRAALENAGSRGLQPNFWTTVGVDKDGTPIQENRADGTIRRSDQKPIQDAQWWRKATGAQQPRGYTALGTTGLITNGSKVFKEQNGELIEVDTPESLEAVGGSLVEELERRRREQGRPIPGRNYTPAPPREEWGLRTSVGKIQY